MQIKKVTKELEKEILLNERIPAELRARSILDVYPDKKRFYFSGKKAEVMEKLAKRRYESNEELRRELKEINLDLTWAPLGGANLSGLDMRNTNFSGSDLSGANLSNANLSHARMSPVKLIDASLQNANMSLANLSLSEASGADFSSANLSMAVFQGARLVSAKFNNSDLSMADLSDCNLTNADFSGAVLQGTVLTNSLLTGTGLERKVMEEDKNEKKKDYRAESGAYSQKKTKNRVYSDVGVYEKKSEYIKRGPYK